MYSARRCTTSTVAAELKNFNKTRTACAAICCQLNVLKHVTFQWRHEYHRGHGGQGRWILGHVVNHYMYKPEQDIRYHKTLTITSYFLKN